ncbi:MAG: mechanosensitive ion channel family protein, partial [Bacteroidota bacterium]
MIILIILFIVISGSGLCAQSATGEAAAEADSVVAAVEEAAAGENGSENDLLPSITKLISFSKIFWALVVFLIGMLLIRLTTRLLEVIGERSARYRITIKGVIPVVRIFGWIILIYIIIAGIFQPKLATILAVSASIGIAVGFASQDILKNVFGGIMILLDRPFKVGDKIELGSYYGEVSKIGLRSTRIITPDDSTVSIPNGDIMNQSVSNANSGENNAQVVAEIYLPISTDTEKARDIATEAAKISRYVYLNKPVTVLFFNDFMGRKSIFKMKIKAYVLDIRYEFLFKSDMTEITTRELIKHGLLEPEEEIYK